MIAFLIFNVLFVYFFFLIFIVHQLLLCLGSHANLHWRLVKDHHYR